MAIRKINLLKTSEAAELPFRSLQEVDDYLKRQVKPKLDELDEMLRQYQLQFSRNEVKSAFEFKINRDGGPTPKAKPNFKADKVERVIIPKLDSLRQNFSVVDELSEQVESLEALYNNVAMQHRNVRGVNDTLKAIKAMKRAAEVKLEKGLVFLRSIGDKYEPSGLKDLVEATMGIIQEGLLFKDYTSYIYCHENKDGHIVFTHYVQLRGLIDDTGFVYPQFYLVFTCILKGSDEKHKVVPHYYVTVMHDFATPGKFILGRQVDSAQRASTVLGLMLDLENIGSAIGVLPHNLDPNKVTREKFSMGSKVANIIVDPSTFTFELLSAVKEVEANDVARQIYVELKTMLEKAGLKKARLKIKPPVKEGSRYVIRYMVTNLAPSDKLSTTDVDWLQDHFQLTDDKLRKVVQIINHD